VLELPRLASLRLVSDPNDIMRNFGKSQRRRPRVRDSIRSRVLRNRPLRDEDGYGFPFYLSLL